KKLAVSLQTHDWASFARGYNGPNFAINQYDVRLNFEYQKYLNNGVPDLDVRAAQLYLTYLGFAPGPVDGIAEHRTMNALSQFLAQNSLPPVATIDAQSVDQLRSALNKVMGAAA